MDKIGELCERTEDAFGRADNETSSLGRWALMNFYLFDKQRHDATEVLASAREDLRPVIARQFSRHKLRDEASA